MKKTNELDLNYFVQLAKAAVGTFNNVEYRSTKRWGEKAGTFEILSFEENAPRFKYSYWKHEQNDTPDGADLGFFTVKITDTKYYNGKIMKVRVSAYVQNEDGVNDRLYVDDTDVETGKRLNAYGFEILNW